MQRPSTHGMLAGAALVLAAFALGQLSAGGGGRLEAKEMPDLPAETRVPDLPQGRGVRPPPPSTGLPTEPTEEPLVFDSGTSQTASANGFVAVTGSYGVGTSVLYLIDTTTRQLAVYEARGGSPGMHRVVLIGARRIDLDLELEGYNDESEFTYRELRRRFERLSKGGSTGDASGDRGASEETAPGRRGK